MYGLGGLGFTFQEIFRIIRQKNANIIVWFLCVGCVAWSSSFRASDPLLKTLMEEMTDGWSVIHFNLTSSTWNNYLVSNYIYLEWLNFLTEEILKLKTFFQLQHKEQIRPWTKTRTTNRTAPRCYSWITTNKGEWIIN